MQRDLGREQQHLGDQTTAAVATLRQEMDQLLRRHQSEQIKATAASMENMQLRDRLGASERAVAAFKQREVDAKKPTHPTDGHASDFKTTPFPDGIYPDLDWEETPWRTHKEVGAEIYTGPIPN